MAHPFQLTQALPPMLTPLSSSNAQSSLSIGPDISNGEEQTAETAATTRSSPSPLSVTTPSIVTPNPQNSEHLRSNSSLQPVEGEELPQYTPLSLHVNHPESHDCGEQLTPANTSTPTMNPNVPSFVSKFMISATQTQVEGTPFQKQQQNGFQTSHGITPTPFDHYTAHSSDSFKPSKFGKLATKRCKYIRQ
ncbi:hypothetical protein BLNAU_17481 [Blattamonas nauphoetae]|uniref:Uncharacterized protein n=1 Tax=Blattamonas nauphoetae TaxID=2049346 RepID=A0ABQ9XBB5_9EUKA|nr:hypothetical protein BLNAU_17481 [Blattamonas nauphoetae]